MTPPAARALSFHAQYRCRNSGDCCTARWPIPVLADTWTRVRHLSGTVAATATAAACEPPPTLPLTESGCAFHDPASHRCRIHGALGHDALPVACQQFPRVSVLDPRGASITLSCFCPTALAMLDEFDGPIAIVNADGTGALGSAMPEGLDARTSLPPALRPNLLMDWESWWAFEARAVALCDRDESLRSILARLATVVEDVRAWTPGDGELLARVNEAFERHGGECGGSGVGRGGVGRGGVGSGGVGEHAALRGRARQRERRFLACHVFANWTAHLGSGLRTWLRSIETVVFLLEQGWTISEVELWLRHFADPRTLANAWDSYER